MKIEPRKHYNIPRYPSWRDDNPLSNPEMLYRDSPHSKKALAVASLLACMAMTAAATGGDDKTEDPQGNPFDLKEHSGLPYHTSPYGTGAPARLNDEVARGIIEGVFSREGIRLQHEVQFDTNGVAFILDGYDPETRIGYVWMNYNNLSSEDAFISWSRVAYVEPLGQTEAEKRESIVYMASHSYRIPREMRQKAKDILEMDRGQERTDSIAKMAEEYDHYIIELDQKQISYAEAMKVDSMYRTDSIYIALISKYDRRFKYNYGWGEPILIDDDEDPPVPEQVRKVAEKEDHLSPEKEAMYALQEAVRSYIAWAREQGQF